MQSLIINCTTGTQEYVTLTPEQEAARLAEIAAYIEPPAPTAHEYELPLVAPEFIVASPKPKGKPKDALLHAAALSGASQKPLAEIVLNLMVYITDLESRVKKLEAK